MNVDRNQWLKKGKVSSKDRTISKLQLCYNKLSIYMLMTYTFFKSPKPHCALFFNKLPALFKILLIFGIVNSSASGRD